MAPMFLCIFRPRFRAASQERRKPWNRDPGSKPSQPATGLLPTQQLVTLELDASDDALHIHATEQLLGAEWRIRVLHDDVLPTRESHLHRHQTSPHRGDNQTHRRSRLCRFFFLWFLLFVFLFFVQYLASFNEGTIFSTIAVGIVAATTSVAPSDVGYQMPSPTFHHGHHVMTTECLF